jgi:hypothetical protein
VFLASQMMIFIRIFPFLVGDAIDEDDEHWLCFRIFWAICHMVSAYEVRPEDPKIIAWLVQVYLESFTALYNASVTPKMHYMTHLPQQMLMFGPLRHHWCMRFESKNAQMKGFTTNCFKNIPLSVAIRHQQWLCYHLAVRPGQISNFIYSGDEVLSGKLVVDYSCLFAHGILHLKNKLGENFIIEKDNSVNLVWTYCI